MGGACLTTVRKAQGSTCACFVDVQACACTSFTELEVLRMTPDRIEREILVAAPVERVWEVLTEPEHIAAWFGPGTPSVDLRPGGYLVLDHGDHGSFPTRIEKVDPPSYLAYRWASGHPGEPATDTNSTLVEFTLVAEGGSTRLTVTESGFATLVIPVGREANASYESHTQGWTEVVQALARHAEQH